MPDPPTSPTCQSAEAPRPKTSSSADMRSGTGLSIRNPSGEGAEDWAPAAAAQRSSTAATTGTLMGLCFDLDKRLLLDGVGQ